MATSTARNLTRFQYAATLLGALAVVVLTPAIAHGEANQPGSGGCNYTDAGGYDIPIDNGQDVSVDGKIASCRNGSIIASAAPKKGGAFSRPPGFPQN